MPPMGILLCHPDFTHCDHAMFAARGCASPTVDSRGPFIDSVLLVRRPCVSPGLAERGRIQFLVCQDRIGLAQLS
jgi:hypothetical protein